MHGRRFLFIPLLALLVCLSACAGSTYSTTELTKELLSAEDTARQYHLNTAWWIGYGSAGLDDTVNLALARNVNLARSAIAVNKALYQARLIDADLFPTFSADSSVAAVRDLSRGSSSFSAADMYAGQYYPGGSTWQRTLQGQASVSYELDLWRRMRDASDAADWEYRATGQDLASARLSLINSVVDAWFKLAYTRQAIAVMEDSVGRYGRLLVLAKDRYTLGKADSVEPLQAEQSLLNAKNQLSSLRSQLAESLRTLRDLLNLRPGDMSEPETGDILAVPLVTVDLNVPVAALAARPDVWAAEARVQGAFNTLESDKSAWYPRLTVGSTLSVSSDKASRFFDVPMLSGLASVSLPFLDWNRLYWNVKISEADFATAKLNLEESVTSALNEVDAACAAYVHARDTLEQTMAVHERDARIADYYQKRYELGRAELKDYLDALNAADNSAMSSLSAKYTLIGWESKIYKSMGGRYEPLDNGRGGR